VTGTGIKRRAFLGMMARGVPGALGLAGLLQLGPPGLLLGDASAATPTTPGGFQIIDAHTHLQPRGPHHPWNDYAGAADSALGEMDGHGVTRTIIMPPPMSPDAREPYDFEDFAPSLRKHPNRFSYLGGGGTLNPMFDDAVRTGAADAGVQRHFEARAREILAGGAAGFGEMACEHFSFGPRHPYESAPPDHPLMLRLAGIAAEAGVPIDVHMEAVRADMPMPARILERSSNNPPTLRANLDRFRALLASNRKASIIWAHAGWDNTGDRTVALCDELMSANPNLYMSLKVGHGGLRSNALMNDDGVAKPGWIALVGKFADRFLIGSDRFYNAPGISLRDDPEVVDDVLGFVRQLPADVARKVAFENPTRLYRLPSSGGAPT
jgi:hypothetical protein